MDRAGIRPKHLAMAGVVALGAAAIVTVSNASQAASGGCRVEYQVRAQWPGGFLTGVTVTNLGPAVDGWTVSWESSPGERIVQGWNADIRQRGGAVSAGQLAWNSRLATRGSATFGFVATRARAAVVPSGFTLNGTACNGAGGDPGAGQPDAPAPPASPPTVTPPADPPIDPPADPPVPTATPVPTTAKPAPPPTSAPAPAPDPGLSAGIPEGYRVVENARPKTVRVFWLKPSDVPFDKRWPDGMAAVVKETQRYYQQELGKTFTLNDQVVEVIEGDHPKAWYENTPQGDDKYWWAVFNMEQEIHRKLAHQNIDQWVNVAEVSAEGDGGGGGGGNGWVILNQHDADGAAGVNGDMNRWYGGMVHEMGHALGLPDSTHTDGTPMSASFYGYPDCHFSQAQKQGLLGGRWSSFLS